MIDSIALERHGRRKPIEGGRLTHSFCRRIGRNDPMADTISGHAHLITGGFPPGSYAGHDHDYARLRLLGLLAERDIPVSVANDFADVEKSLPVSQLLITYVAGPYPDATQCRAIADWLEGGGHLLGLRVA